jgi:hypothetical protein
MSARIAELQQLAEEQTKRITGGSRGVGGGTSSFTTGPEGGVQSGHFSFSRSEQGAAVFETHRFHQGHEITLIERLRLNDDGKSLGYSLDISGPRQERHIEISFEVS